MWAWRRRNTAGSPMFSSACCIGIESMALAHPRPLVGVGIAHPRDGRSPERPMGGGSRGPTRLSNPPSLVSLIRRRDPLPLSSPTRGEEAQPSDPRVNSIVEGASDPSARDEIILSIKRAGPKADRLVEHTTGGRVHHDRVFATARPTLGGAAAWSPLRSLKT